jgi:tRNA 2-thiouridine synthesizing protein E
MLDINNAMTHRDAYRHDPDGNMFGLDPWSREIARQTAMAEGLGELGEAQWRVIFTLRGLYRKHGPADNAASLIRAVERDFVDEGGRRFLYEIFPLGPISQGCRLAGIPPPPYARDLSFGSFG